MSDLTVPIQFLEREIIDCERWVLPQPDTTDEDGNTVKQDPLYLYSQEEVDIHPNRVQFTREMYPKDNGNSTLVDTIELGIDQLRS
jgi:hypothetical protein